VMTPEQYAQAMAELGEPPTAEGGAA
jgi:hypothetical protein